MPQRVTLSPDRPQGLKRVPDSLAAPLFGKLTIGPKESPATVLLILDEPDDKPARLFVDANGNGDLTDDPAAEWQAKSLKTQGGGELKQYSGGAMIGVRYGGDSQSLHLSMYRFDKHDPQRSALKNVLLYYRDYATAGEVAVGGKTYQAMLSDDLASGDFRGQSKEMKQGEDNAKNKDKDKDKEESSGVRFLIDLNGDAKYDFRNEMFDSHQPFNIAGETYELADVNASGTSFKVIKSDRSVPEIAPPPDLSAGRKAIEFEAKTTDGHSVKFPSAYRGKLVILDFWATWCGPCVADLPNLTKNAEAMRGRALAYAYTPCSGVNLQKCTVSRLIQE